ncbi:kinase domain-containing protein [Cucurbitaria berberidis CBS 394.84]|uniref:EKC/KEOPS complex subunit BUD32 n=1 Tax=Cucurbitaria berberidis CBS 394.84 TaxID=1168544 RepID=A0A9P4L4G8_9PLEO|nr:kinase domain-containing protein [Cucurbitaria berberidis CBS 394.84]KAF1841475.1 kinase domain-containing protein [Cucurbitaria berberidis CBS 394.84]
MSTFTDAEEEEYYDIRFLLPQGVGVDTEDIEKYRPGGFHPVHLGDRYDDGRYRIVHKLGAGGFSTVWLARDEDRKKWVALKIVDAEHSASAAEKSVLSHGVTSNLQASGAQFVVEHHRQFTFDGPNGHHLCLVLPVLGPSASELSYHFTCRLTPQLARTVAYQATRAIADLHSQGLCHGDVTTGNFCLSLCDIDRFGEGDIYRLFGRPTTGELETESGEMTGPEAPRYIVEAINFLAPPSNIINTDIKLIDFDQCFPISTPPEELLGTPLEFLAPEVAVGLAASPASDIWALGCCIFRLRSGEGPFESPFDVTCPADLISYIIHTLGDMPRKWHDTTLWDSQGRPTKDPSKGKPHKQWWEGDERSLKDIVYNIWDEPKSRVVQTGTSRPEEKVWFKHQHQPFPSCFSDMVWNPKAIKVDNVYLSGYNNEWGRRLKALPKIPEHEAALLDDLLSKIFVYDPTKRPTATEMLNHPWFHLDGPLDGP